MGDTAAPVVLETERLRLRPFCEADVLDAWEYRSDPEFVKFLPHIPYPFTWADAERFVSLNMAEDWQTSPTFAVVLHDKLIGTVNFEIERVTRAAMLGYAIGRRWWGYGFVTEAASEAIRWARQAHGLSRLWASTDVRNEKSQRVLARLGFTRESVRVAAHPSRDGAMVDEVVYGLQFET